MIFRSACPSRSDVPVFVACLILCITPANACLDGMVSTTRRPSPRCRRWMRKPRNENLFQYADQRCDAVLDSRATAVVGDPCVDATVNGTVRDHSRREVSERRNNTVSPSREIRIECLRFERPAKVMAKAFRAGFQRIAQRARPLPVGSMHDVLADFLNGAGEPAVAGVARAQVPQLFVSTQAFVDAALDELYDNQPEDALGLRREDNLLSFLAPDDLVHRLADLPGPT